MRNLLYQFLKWFPAAVVGGAIAIASVWEGARDWISAQVLVWYATMNAAPALWLLYAALVGVYVWALIYTGREPKPVVAGQTSVVPPALFEAQLAELREVEDFVARKSENELRDTFAFRETLDWNVRLVRVRVSGQADPAVDQFFEGGQSRLDVTRVKMTKRLDDGALNFDFIPDRVGLINIPLKYIESRQTLARMASSPRLPTDVIRGLKKLDETVEENSVTLMSVLDEALQADPTRILNHGKSGTPQYAWVNNAYWHRFRNLKPIADEISAAIRSYLKVS